MSQTPGPPSHAVAVIGGATAGAEVASRLAERGVHVTVFEQNPRPFGKIEDGLPRWHTKLREMEYERITKALTHPLIHVLPNTAIGSDVAFKSLLDEWQFSAVVLANGAWRDRPLEVSSGPKPETLVGKGFEYQNPFVIAFNHVNDKHYTGRTIEIPNGGGAVIGGGLAAIDMAKILNLVGARRALQKRGIQITIDELEHGGIDKTLDEAGLEWSDLGIEAATIYYRKRIADMPVMAMPEGADFERRAQVEATREKLVAKVRSKYLVEIEPLCVPKELIVEGGRVTGLALNRTVLADGRMIETNETFLRPAKLVVSSIGSIPEPIAGLAMRGELFETDSVCPSRLAGFDNVFGVGNVLTGKGNITVSRRHAIAVSEGAIETYLGIAEGQTESADPRPAPKAALDAAAQTSEDVARFTQTKERIAAAPLAAIERRVLERQALIGYQGDLAAWIAQTGEPHESD
jgi:ferredoxin/flavodoxin---NADP+ reductase